MDPRIDRLNRTILQGSSAETRSAWARTYEETRYDHLPWFSPSPASWIAQGFRERWLRAGGRHLEIGCGAGTNALWLARQGLRTVGVDLAPGAVRAARRRSSRLPKRSRVAFVNGDALALPFAEASFASSSDIGCFHALPVDRRGAYARELHRVLRPGGLHLLSWVAREETRPLGPPHRPSVQEVASSLEELFLMRRVEFRAGRGSSKNYSALLERRAEPQPPAR